MKNPHWQDLVSLIDRKDIGYLPVGFIIDSPWIPGWYGISYIDYYSSDRLWLESNLKAVTTFPDVWFMPSFWSEYGMCTEPSAFGSRLVFLQSNLPHAEKVITDLAEAGQLPQPNVKTDGLLPFMINRLKTTRNEIIKSDHDIRFAVSRGPLNIASFLMGTTEFMLSLTTDPEGSHRLLKKITTFISDWLEWQKECFPSIDGVLVLDDIIGFVGETEFDEFVTPFLKKIMNCTGSRVRFLHNDADGLITAAKIRDLDVNMFNFSFNHSMGEIRELAGDDVILVGNIPARDVLGSGTTEDVEAAVNKAFREVSDHGRIIWSAGGGMPQGVSTANINAFISTVRKLHI